MDFGPFILFGLVLLAFLVYGSYTLWMATHGEVNWKRRLRPLLGMAAFLIASGLFIYKAFFLDEALVSAAMSGDTATMKSLLARGANPNAQWEDGTSAINWAKKNHETAAVALLRKAGAQE